MRMLYMPVLTPGGRTHTIPRFGALPVEGSASHVKQPTPRRKREMDYAAGLGLDAFAEEDSLFGHTDLERDARLEDEERLTLLGRVVMSRSLLTEKQRRAFRSHYEGGLSVAETARRMGVSKATAQGAIETAVRKIRWRLAQMSGQMSGHQPEPGRGRGDAPVTAVLVILERAPRCVCDQAPRRGLARDLPLTTGDLLDRFFEVLTATPLGLS